MSRRLVLLAAVLLLAGCDEGKKAAAPPPAPYDANAVAHFCGMTLGEHGGPKGQIWVGEDKQPVWFTSVHDAIAFTLLPEEPKDLRAIYVTDMAKATDWQQAAATAGWVDAKRAHFVIGSDATGGMGSPEEVPFSDPAAAEAFARQHGGRVVGFDQIPRDAILGTPVGGGMGGGQMGKP